MFAATRRWFRRNRTPIAVGVGIMGAGYVATQYLLSKINDARERMSSERIAKENLRRRFEQNQEDCTFTVLALLPTVTTNVLEALNTEDIAYQIQHMKAPGRGGVAAAKSESGGSVSPPSIADTLATEDEGRSVVSLPSEGSGLHAGQAGSVEGGPAAGPAVRRKSKRQLWDELTISSLTRAYSMIYTVALLVMLTRIQLNLLGRRSYLSSVVSLATGSAQATISLEDNDDDNPEHLLGSSDFDVNRKYLALSWWLLNRSWAEITARVEAAVRAVFGHLSPRDLVSLETFADLTRQVRQAVEQDPLVRTPPPSFAAAAPASAFSPSAEAYFSSSRWLALVLPPPELETYVLKESGILAEQTPAPFSASASQSTIPAPLRRMIDETADLVESPTFAHVLALLLDAGFATLVENKVAPAAFDLPPSAGEGSTELVRLRSHKTVQLPKVLSVLTREAHVIGSSMPNEYLQEMEAVRDLEAFAAVVYSSNWEGELRQEEAAVAAEAAAAEAEAATARGTSAGTPEPEAEMMGPFSTRRSARRLSGEESLVVVDASQSMESAWERALGSQASGSQA